MERNSNLRAALVAAACVLFSSALFAEPLSSTKVEAIKLYFLNDDIDKAISEGEKLMETADYSSASEELYYILGLCYLKDGNYLRASDIFEIVLKEFKDGTFRDQAKLGLADSYYMAGEYGRAESLYKELLVVEKLQPIVYHRLSQVCRKKGDAGQAEEYQHTLKEKFPDAMETVDKSELVSVGVRPSVGQSSYFTIQVGSFTKSKNADTLCARLKEKGFDAYLQEVQSEGKTMYRVKVGKFKSQQEAALVRDRLIEQGYPTKMSP